MRVLAHQGDTVDSLCYRHLGSSAAVEQVLDANPGLAALRAVLPQGTPVELPEEAQIAAPAADIINLWD